MCLNNHMWTQSRIQDVFERPHVDQIEDTTCVLNNHMWTQSRIQHVFLTTTCGTTCGTNLGYNMCFKLPHVDPI